MVDIGLLVFHIEFFEGHELQGLLDEGLDDGHAGEALLGEIRQLGEGGLTDVPLFGHVAAHHRGGAEQKRHGDQGEDRHQAVQMPHLAHRQDAHEDGVAEHHDAPAEALLDRVQIVGEEAHEVADLVDLIILPAQEPGPVEHFRAQTGLQENGGAKEAHAPDKPAQAHAQDHANHGHAHMVQQEIQVKGQNCTVHGHGTRIHAVHDHLVQLRDDEL